MPSYQEKGVVVDALDPEHENLIAIVGMGCRWPGGVRNTSQLWDLLKEQRDGWARFDSSRINLDGFYHPNGQRPGSMYTVGGHLLQEDPRDFDHAFFGITATEALSMDPTQRKLLEVTYEAFENAGETWEKISGSRTGVFVGNFNNEHQMMQLRDPDFPLPYAVTGGGATILSNRINYVFNLRGPSMMVDTACSASMYALHIAVMSIQNGDCDAAIVAGGNLILTPDAQILTTKLGAVSPTSRSHTFDIAADGYSRAEGFGALYVKKLSDAIAAGDPIRAVIRGSSFNANGKTGGISHPSPEGQEAVIREAYKAAGNLDPALTGYFECHGTGTPVGDPIEVTALGRVFSPVRDGNDPLLIGAIKPNLGHSEPTSALAQIMKVILAMEHGAIPATIGIENFNPAIDFEKARAKVVTEMTPWPRNRLLRVSINSFGYGGANSHCILDHPSQIIPGYKLNGQPLSTKSLNGSSQKLRSLNGNGNNVHALGWFQPYELIQLQSSGSRSVVLVPFSAHDESALKESIAGFTESASRYELSDLLFTLSARRSMFSRRAFAILEHNSVRSSIGANLITTGKAPSSMAQNIAFIFTGQGAQWPEMGFKLMHEYHVFRQAIRYLDDILGHLNDGPSWTIEEVLAEAPDSSRVHEPQYSQTVCTALQIALISLLEQWGIRPVATVGHSSGEIAAAYAAGRLRASEAIVFAYYRGQAVSQNQQRGLMLAVGLGPKQVAPYLRTFGGKVQVAAVNSPESTTISGDSQLIHELAEALTARNVFNRILKTGNNAYHSHHMLKLGTSYEKLAAQGLRDIMKLTEREPCRASITWISSVNPEVQADATLPSYWRQNLESPVLFSDAVLKLAHEVPVDLLIELGPHPALSGPVKQIRSYREKKGQALPPCLESLRRGENDVSSMLKLAGRLFINNAPINLVAVNATERVRGGRVQLCHGFPCIDMPQYPFTYPEKPIYFENRFNKEYRTRKYPRHDLLGSRLPGCSRAQPSWRNVLRIKDLPWLNDHRLVPHAVLPAAAYVAMAVEAARQMHNDGPEPDPIKSFKLRNVAVNSTMKLEDNEFGVETVLNMGVAPLTNTNLKSEWYNFSISSIDRDTDIWTEHCSGMISVVTGAWDVNDSKKVLQADPRSRLLDIGRWYEKFQEVGLGYGPTFRCLSNLRAYHGAPTAVAEVALNSTADTIKGGESKYILHPATLDACLQLALISIHSGQVENATNAFVPILLNNMSIWVPRSTELRGEAVAIGETLGVRSAYAQIQLQSFKGHRLLDIGELKCVTYDGRSKSDRSSAMPCEPYWKVVSAIDIDTLTNDFAQISFPPATIATSVMEKVDSLYEHMLVDTARTLREARVSEQEGSHNAFAQWVQTWHTSSASQTVSDLEHEQLMVDINNLVNEVGDIPEASCLKVLNDNLSAIIGGQTNSIKILMEHDLLDNLYISGVAVREAHVQLERLVNILAHKAPRMRILEIGGKAGGATAVLLDTLRSKTTFKRFDEYVFSDPSERSILDAQVRFNNCRGVTFQGLDIEGDIEAQGFTKHSFDLILLNGSFNMVSNASIALQNVHNLLRPGGSLAIISPKRRRLSLEFLNRLLAGRWDDADQITDASKWHRMLTKYGFLENRITLEDYASDNAMSTVILATKPGISSKGSAAEVAQVSRVVLVYRDYPPPLAGVIDRIMQRQGFTCVYVNLLSQDKIPPGSHIISLADIETSTMLHGGEDYFQAIQTMVETTNTLVWVAGGNSADRSQAAIMKGLLRSIASESVHIETAFIELHNSYLESPERTAKLIIHKFNELRTSSPRGVLDRECVLAGNNLYIERLLPETSLSEAFRLRCKVDVDLRECPLREQGPLKATYQQPGLLSSLYFEPDISFQKLLSEGWVEIKTEAIGLNMKDIAIATGKFDANHSSHEAAGVVSRVGPGVASFKEGDRVYGLILGNMGNYMRSPESFVSKIPVGESFASAASMPISYLTAIYALQHIARLTQGESVLIQSAAGSLGLAAIRIARHLGAEIYVTVGNDQKRDFIANKFGVPRTHIFQSRAPNIVESIMRQTKGEGIDVILNGVAGNAMHEMWRCIAPLGRFIDLGRTDVLGAGKISLEVFKRNATFSSFDISRILDQKPKIIKQLMAELQAFWEKGIIGPIDEITPFEVSELNSAMTFFSKGQHIGKVVIRFDDPTSTVKVACGMGRVTFDPEALYLLVGCLGGLGKSLATWMVERGARHLVFLSRSGAKTSETKEFLQDLISLGVNPQVIPCDVTDYGALESALIGVAKERPVKGVVHAAMVEGDGIFSQTTHDKVQKVLAPKVAGTTNLHEATKGFPLDFFIMTSSIVGVVGTPSQSAYSAAGAFQDAFAWMRKSMGLPATSIDLGLILEVGFVSGSKKTQQMLQRVLAYGQSETEFLQLIEGAFCQSSQSESSPPAQIVCNLDPARFLPWADSGRLSDLVWHKNARFQAVAQAIQDISAERGLGDSQSTDSSSSWSKRLQTASSAQEQTAIAEEAVTTYLAKLLSIAADDIDARKPMSHYGLDSLVAAELRNWLMRTFGVEVTALHLLSGAANVESLANSITSTKCSARNDEMSEVRNIPG